MIRDKAKISVSGDTSHVQNEMDVCDCHGKKKRFLTKASLQLSFQLAHGREFLFAAEDAGDFQQCFGPLVLSRSTWCGRKASQLATTVGLQFMVTRGAVIQ